VKRALLCCLALLAIPTALMAQVANNTSLVGTVTDQSGQIVVGAHVTGINLATKVAYTGDTNAEGFYSIPYVAPGTYNITVEMSGFEKSVSSGVLVSINLAVRTDVKLVVGSTSSEVTVSANTAALSTDDAVLGETIDQNKVQNLPMNGRHALNLAATASNIQVTSGSANPFIGNPPGASAIGAGTRPVNNSLTLDGVTIMNNLGSTSSVSPNPDTLGAVQTQNGNYPAQYGNYMGVHIDMSTTSGTNQFHGTAYDYIQNDVMNAKAWLALPGQKKSELRYNEFGGVIGGPILIPHLYNGRDKTFFLASYEGLRDNFGTVTPATVITSAMRSGNFSALSTHLKNPQTGQFYGGPAGSPDYNIIPTNQLSPQALNVLQYLTLPTQPGVVNNFNNNVPSSVTMDQTNDRVDHNIGQNVRLFGRFTWQKINSASGAVNPSSNAYAPTTDRNGAFGYTHTITPNLVNDFRFGFNVLNTQQLNFFFEFGPKNAGSLLGIPGFTSDVTANNPGLPSINITGYQGTAGEDGTNWFQDDRTLQGGDQLSWTHGKHTVMTGVELYKLTLGRAAQNGARGTFTFNGQYSGDGAADFLLGAAQQVITPYFQVKGSVGQWRDGFFVQDTWQIRPDLTLQYGLRYELPTVAYSLNGNGRILNSDFTALVPTSSATSAKSYTPVPGFKFTGPNHSDWAPRFGLSYRATNKIVVRMGGGIYYNANHLNAFTLASTNYPFSSAVTYTGSTAGSAPTLTFANPTAGAGASPVAGTLGTYVNAFTDNHYLPTPRLYQWNVDTGVEAWKNAGFELQYLGSRGIHLDESYYPNSGDPGPGNVNAKRPYQLFGTIREIQNDSFSTYHGLTAILRQRLTHGLNMNLGYTWSHSMDTSADSNSGGTAMWQGHLKLDYGNSNWDIRNRFVGSLTYQLPYFGRNNFWEHAVLAGWQANSIITFQTGMPMNITIPNGNANVDEKGSERPNYVHAGSATCSTGFYIQHPKTSCIDTTAYAEPAKYTFGNLHRNDIYGPGYNNVDFSLFKDIGIHEDVNLQLRLEAFNVFNHPSPANPVAGNLVFGTGSFGAITQVQGAARVLQVAGKINF
jgi:carboxypeptidase family protein